nr:MAG TPA: hypothetical protein [Caudoviricetes sp.]
MKSTCRANVTNRLKSYAGFGRISKTPSRTRNSEKQ